MRAKCLARSRKRAAAGHLPLIRPAATFPQGGRLQSGRLRHTRPSSGLRPPSPKGEGSKAGRLPAKGKAFAYDKKGVTQLNTEKVISRDNEIPALAFQTGAGIVIGFVIYMLLKKSGVAGRLSGMVK